MLGWKNQTTNNNNNQLDKHITMSNLNVTGFIHSSTPELGLNANGLYILDGTYEDKPQYTRSSGGFTYVVRYQSGAWAIRSNSPNLTIADGTNVENPWDATFTPKSAYDFSGTISVTQAAAAPSTVTFPASPTLNQSFTSGTRTWVFNGTAWKLQAKTTDQISEGTTNKYYTDARVAAAPAVSALETRAGNIESAATTLAGRVTSAEGSITTLTSGLATEKGRVDAILNASQADKDSFAEIVTLINSIDTDNDQAFAGYVLSNDAAVATKVDSGIHASDITSLQGQISGIDARVVGLEYDLSGVNITRITDIEGAALALTSRVLEAESDITAIESAATALTTRVTTAESDIDALETGKQIKNVISATAPSHVEGLIWIDTTDMSSYVSYGSIWVELDKA